MSERLPRKLAAILYADVAGYSRLTGADEDATHRKLGEYLDLIDREITAHRGKVMHYAGDAVLAMFEAVSDSVICAVSIQRLLTEKNEPMPDDSRIQFRIGVNLGDVIEDRGDIYGDGVNVAARLESIAEPGGICVSSAVYEQVHGKLDLYFQDMGTRELKNIDGPVRAYRISDEALPTTAAETYEFLTGERLEFPQKPSIAVLPFQNMSGDAEQEHFADGMSEDIITVLSRVPDLVVIARNSTFVYKGQSVDVRRVGRELGVGFALEGSIRKSGERLRITAQLINTQNGDHIWAERYDRHLNDIFAIQDEITREIVIALSVKLTWGEESRVWSERTTTFETWEMAQHALAHQMAFTREGNREAIRLARKIMELHPEFKMPWALLGWALLTGVRYGFTQDPQTAMAEAYSIARQILEQDDQDGDGHALLGFLLTNQRKFEEGIQHCTRAIELNPSMAAHHGILAIVLYYAGDYVASLARMKKALRLSPYAQDWCLAFLSDANRSLGELERARDVCEHLIKRMPASIMSLTRLAAIYSDLDEIDKARKAAEDLMEVNPQFSVGAYVSMMPFKRDSDRESLANALLKAGLPA